MRAGISIIIALYCVWQTKNNGTFALATKEVLREKEDHKQNSFGRDKDVLYPPPLVSPYGGTLKLVFGISVPIALAGDRTLGFGQNFQFQFPLPQNATFFTNYFDDAKGRSRWRRTAITTTLHRRRNVTSRSEHTRSTFYRSLELAFERWGGHGKDCMMRSICEAAESPLKDEGLVGELLHAMLTPDYGDDAGFNTPDNSAYFQAAQAGRSKHNCSLIYPSCLNGLALLDRVSQVVYT